MKKRVASILIAVIILSIVFALPVTQKTTINITASFDNTVPQIIKISNWKNWYPEIKRSFNNSPDRYILTKDSSDKTFTIEIPDKKYFIRVITPMSYQVREENSHWVDIYAFTFLSTDTPGRLKIDVVKRNPLLFTLFGGNKAGENAINGLKNYLEDPKLFYGFDIQMSKIRDSVIASSVFKIKKAEVFTKIKYGYQNLLRYVRDHSLLKTDHVSISYIRISEDSIQLTIGVPVNQEGPSEKEITCLALPARGNVLTGNYEGLFHDRKTIYLAMSKYLSDHALSVPAESFERYLNDSIPASDSSFVKIELNYPVY
jgi:effector-binding domain-containing protein